MKVNMKYLGKITKYLSQSLGYNGKFQDLGTLKSKLPFGLLGAADYSILDIEGISTVAIKPNNGSDFRFIKNLAATVCRILGMNTILLPESLDSYQRRSLIESRTGFIVPERQIYLPAIGILLNERGLGMQKSNNGFLSPMAMAVLIFHLSRTSLQGKNVTEIAELMGYSVKSLSIAIFELQNHELVSVSKCGRKKICKFPKSSKELWEQAYPLMSSPVDRLAFTDDLNLVAEIGVKASDSALAKMSMLAEPEKEVYAIYARDPRLKELSLNPYDGAISVEIWKTNPALTAIKKVADPFSLALSYKNDDDPRINIELKKVLKESLKD